MAQIPFDILHQMICDQEAIERAKILPLAPPGPYTAKCDEANWLEDGNDFNPGRLLLLYQFPFPTPLFDNPTALFDLLPCPLVGPVFNPLTHDIRLHFSQISYPFMS